METGAKEKQEMGDGDEGRREGRFRVLKENLIEKGCGDDEYANREEGRHLFRYTDHIYGQAKNRAR